MYLCYHLLAIMHQGDSLWPSFVGTWLNPLPNEKTLDVTKLKAFADDKLNVAKMTIFLFNRAENIVGVDKKMLVTGIFSFSHSVFQSFLLKGR